MSVLYFVIADTESDPQAVSGILEDPEPHAVQCYVITGPKNMEPAEMAGVLTEMCQCLYATAAENAGQHLGQPGTSRKHDVSQEHHEYGEVDCPAIRQVEAESFSNGGAIWVTSPWKSSYLA